MMSGGIPRSIFVLSMVSMALTSASCVFNTLLPIYMVTELKMTMRTMGMFEGVCQSVNVSLHWRRELAPGCGHGFSVHVAGAFVACPFVDCVHSSHRHACAYNSEICRHYHTVAQFVRPVVMCSSQACLRRSVTWCACSVASSATA
jgi:hypothetical protein